MPVEGKIVTSPFESIHVPDDSVWILFKKTCEKHQDKVALIDHSFGKSVTYRQLHDLATTVARGLLDTGYRKSDILTIYSPNCLEFVVTCLAVWRLGGTVACLNALLSIDEVRHELALLGSTTIIAHQHNITSAIVAASGTNITKQIVIGRYPGCISFSSLCELSPIWPPLPDVIDSCVNNYNDVAVILFSSGTTGLPKGVMIRHKSIVGFGQVANLPGIQLAGNNPFVIYLPLSHVYGLGMLQICLLQGVPMILMAKFDLETYLQQLQKHKSEAAVLVPPVALLLCKSGITRKYDRLPHVNTVMIGAAPLPQEVEEDLPKQFKQKIDLKQAYGLTETGMATLFTSARHGYKATPFGSCGAPGPNIRLKVVHPETKKELGPNEVGEIYVNNSYGNMKGYYKNEEATRRSLLEGNWFATGDLGHYDKDGFFFIVDRIKELIKYKGFQVAPAELEALLLTHPAVADCGVTGIPNQEAGEVPLAWIVLKPGHKATEGEIQQFVSEKVAPYKKLRGGVKFVELIPKSPSGKILRREIKRLSLEDLKSKL